MRILLKPIVQALGLAFILVWSTASAAPMVAKINWSSCYQEFGPGFECAIVNVPMDYSTANEGAAVQLSVVRLLAGDPANKIGSILVNPGGPGGSGVNFALFFGPFAGAILGPEVAAKFDIVGFDPRGIGRSTGVKCFGNEKQAVEVSAPFAFPLTAEEEAIQQAGDALLAHQCGQRGSKIGEHMSTANVARDMDYIREALGESGLTYLGLSYGSYLGNVYANLFPDKVRAVVIDGVIDPVAWANEEGQVPFTTRLGSSKGAQDTLDRFFELCVAAGGKCLFARNSATAEELAARYKAIAESLLAAPLDLGGGFVVTYQLLISVTLGSLYNPASYPFLAADLAFVEDVLGTGNFGAVAPALAQYSSFVNKRGFPNYQNFAESFPAVGCSDSNNPNDYDVWSTEGANADLDSYFGRLWTWASSPCAQWPLRDASRFNGPFNEFTANPVLVIGNLYDPATPYEGALAADAGLPNSVLLTVDVTGHVSLGLSACAGFFTGQYLLNPQGIGGLVDAILGDSPCPGFGNNENPFDIFPGPFGGGDTEADLNTELRLRLLSEIGYGPRHH